MFVGTNCGDGNLASGTHQIDIDIDGNTSKTTSYNVAYLAPGATAPPVGLPMSMVSLAGS